MSIAALSIAQVAIGAQSPAPKVQKSPPGRRTVAKADAIVIPEPR